MPERVEFEDLRELLDEVLATVPGSRSVWCRAAARFETTVVRRRGFLLGGAWAPQFLDESEDLWPVPWTLELRTPRVLRVEQSTAPFWKWVPLLESVAKGEESLLLVTGEIGEELLRTLILNLSRRTIRACAVRPPEDGEALAPALGRVFTDPPGDHRRLPCMQEAWVRRGAAVLLPKEEGEGADEIAVLEVGGEDAADQRARLRFLAEAIRRADRP